MTSKGTPRLAEDSVRSSADESRPSEQDSLAPLSQTHSRTNYGTAEPSSARENESAERDDVDQSRVKRWALNALWFIYDQWFLVALGCLIAIASQYQVSLSQQSIKETVVTYLAVALIFFITGCTLSTKALFDNYTRWKLHLFVQFQCFFMTSAIVFGVVTAAATNENFMDPWLLIGMIMAGCIPTTISSNVVMTEQAHGNTPLTVVQSTLGNFIAPFLTPLLIQMYLSTGAWYTKVLPPDTGGYGEIYRRVFRQLGLSLYLPMVTGQIVRYFFPRGVHTVLIKWKLSKISPLALLTIIWQAFDQAFASGAFHSVKGDNMIFIVFMNNAFFLIWLAVCFLTSILWLNKADTISVSYCVPAKTPAMGVPLSVVLFLGLTTLQESKLQIPMVIYQAFQIIFGSILTIPFRKWIRPEEEANEREAEETANKDVQGGDGAPLQLSEGVDGGETSRR